MRYLITGKNGQLAQEFIRRFELTGIDYLAPDESELDITNAAAVDRIADAWRPDIVLNCAAYNLVDKAEHEREKAFAVNASGPEYLARAAARRGALVVHYGTDYVFDGKKENGLYTEQDPVNPLNAYGESKLAGENAVVSQATRHLIFRLSWVFGSGTQNFIYKLRQWAGTSDYLKIACDEFSVPTFTGTVVDVTLRSVERGLVGRFHLTNSGYCSRYEWAQAIAAATGMKKFIRPVLMQSFGLPAQRPGFSAMSNEAVSAAAAFSIPTWEEAVQTFLRESTT